MSANPNLPKATRAERAAEAARLRDDEGLNGVQIAERMGVSASYAYELLSDPEGVWSRVRKESHGGECVDCGATTAYVTGGVAERCRACRREKERDLDLRQATSRKRSGAVAYSDQEIIAALRSAARDGTLTCAGYDAARAKAPAGAMPSRPTIVVRFGRWGCAVAAAGLVDTGRGEYSNRLSEAGALLAVEECARDLGFVPTASDYATWARATGAPCCSTIRNRCGGWMRAVALVADRLAGERRAA